MIQDIAPHNFDITYMDGQPKDDSAILFFRNSHLLVGQVSDGQTNEIHFPSYKEICDKEIGGEFAYFFRLDETSFFYYNVD